MMRVVKILIFNDENVFSENNVNEYKPKFKILLNFLGICIYIMGGFFGGGGRGGWCGG